jgi:hypothetical protein
MIPTERGVGNRPVDEIDGACPDLLAELLKTRDFGDMSEPVAITGERRTPIEFLLGIDGQLHPSAETGCEHSLAAKRRWPQL